jgi:hypothetical protein
MWLKKKLDIVEFYFIKVLLLILLVLTGVGLILDKLKFIHLWPF